MITKLIHNRGGLHNRVTKTIRLEPFTLRETELLLKNKGGVFDKYHGAQIDLVIDRSDRVINICEMKFLVDEFVINKTYAQQLKNKISVFRESVKTNKTVRLTFISTFGVKRNEYAVSLVQNDLTMDVLFL